MENVATNGAGAQTLVRIDPAEFGLEATEAQKIESAFTPMLEKMTELEDRFNEVAARASGEITVEVCEEARRLRLDYVRVRSGTAAIHKTAKAYYLAGGRFVDGWKNAQAFASQGKEERLEAIEKHFERIEAEKIAALAAERAALLEPYDMDPTHLNLGKMDADVWENFLAGARMRHEARVEAERKAEEERRAAEEAERERIRQQAEENARLKAEAEKREAEIRVERERLEKERKAAEEAARKEREVAEAKARKEREEAEARLKAEREERERVERELQAKREAEAKVEAERQAAIEAEKAKGEEERFADFVAELAALPGKYDFRSRKYRAIHADAVSAIHDIVVELDQFAGKIAEAA